MPENPFTPTPQQEDAIHRTGGSVIVSAAAGSGKTAVLAQRCVFLVCDAPPDQRCDIDRLLVLTFTDAAAAEMRSRIIELIRQRLADRPGDVRLRQQLALADTAQMSTIHSFCLWLVRRWFNRLNIDPTATVLDADEASLIKKEILDELFGELYASMSGVTDGNRLGQEDLAKESDEHENMRAIDDWQPGCRDVAALGSAFVTLVDDYGLGEDRDVAAMVLRLSDFCTSLPDPVGWLRDAVAGPAGQPQRLVDSIAAELATELHRQEEHCAQLAEALEADDPAGHFHAGLIRAYSELVARWAAQFDIAGGDQEKLRDAFDEVRQEIAEHEFDKHRAPPLSKDSPDQTKAVRKAASACYSEVKATLFRKRLVERFALFSTREWVEGLERTAPYVATLVDLVLSLQTRYADRKRRLGVMEFADLERFAFDLLVDRDAGHGITEPSDVAQALHDRFAHVLVDEFQDINPLQQAILQHTSRETDPERESNFFVVGDVKQSIYRFRLAEPSLFRDRLDASRAVQHQSAPDEACDGSRGSAIFLQSNFRSRPEILESVNLIFRCLMRKGACDMEYDAEAELHAGRSIDDDSIPEPVEIHLLERSAGPTTQADTDDADEEPTERGVADLGDPSRWTPIEREAYVIATRIGEWINDAPADQPRRYRDIAILLRAARINAERMASILAGMGVPAHAQVGGSLLGALEVRDVLAALEILDNLQQDIPLAAVLRSGVFGETFTEDQLVEIRLLDRNAPFHAVVCGYAERGLDEALRQRVERFLKKVARYRRKAARRPLAETLWQLLEDEAYLAYAAGLPNGPQRRANLLKLHDLTRRFGTFRRQGLHRFLQFVRTSESSQREIDLASTLGESEDVVRIMSIHRAKGLEFPVVFVAALGSKFNLGDRSGRMIFERNAKIGLRVVDTQRMLEYPSAAHRCVAMEVERSTREEEMRVLYVAMTRARDKLVLVGTQHNIDRHLSIGEVTTNRPPSRLTIATATTPLDWILPTLAAAPQGSVSRNTQSGKKPPLFELHFHGAADQATWSATRLPAQQEETLTRAVARCEPLPAGEPVADDDPVVVEIVRRLDFVYPWLATSSVRATAAASEFKGAYDYTRDPDVRADRNQRGQSDSAFDVPPSKYTTASTDAAVHRGIITHRVLEHLDFQVSVDEPGVARELQRLVDEGIIAAEDRGAVPIEALTWFVKTPLAEAIRLAGGGYRREFRYVTTESVADFDRSISASDDDRVLVRGMVDGIIVDDEGLEIVDFKTDAIEASEVPQRCERYQPQMEMYCRAMARIWRRPVRVCWLVFLTPRQVVPWRDFTTTEIAS